MMLQYYANLGIKINGEPLMQQCGVVIEDHVNKRCRVTVESALPESGPEFDARVKLGATVKLSVHIVTHRGREYGPAIVELEGPVVASRIEQPAERAGVRAIFTVEQGRVAPEDE